MLTQKFSLCLKLQYTKEAVIYWLMQYIANSNIIVPYGLENVLCDAFLETVQNLFKWHNCYEDSIL